MFVGGGGYIWSCMGGGVRYPVEATCAARVAVQAGTAVAVLPPPATSPAIPGPSSLLPLLFLYSLPPSPPPPPPRIPPSSLHLESPPTSSPPWRRIHRPSSGRPTWNSCLLLPLQNASSALQRCWMKIHTRMPWYAPLTPPQNNSSLITSTE